MLPRKVMVLGTAGVAVPAWGRRDLRTFSVPSLAGRLVLRREAVWLTIILLIAGFATAINMFHFPYFEDDEGVYMSQAWSVLTEGQLAPYSYWYDHAPAGWLFISIYTTLLHGFHLFGSAVETGRVLMLGIQIASTYLLYRIAQRMSGSTVVASLAALLFALSAFGIYFHRRVLLDNFTTLWMLASILLLLTATLQLKHIWLSALTFGISVLSKENTILLFPALVYLVYYRTTVSRRAFALGTWLFVAVSVISLYILLALLKGELFPEGTLLGGSNPHVSLIGTLQYQANRSKDGGLLDLHSGFYHWMGQWAHDEPLLIVGGTACALLSLVLFPWRRMVGVAGLLTICMMAFLARGGEVLEFYVVPLLPLLALNIALIFGVATEWLRQPGDRVRGAVRAAFRGIQIVLAAAVFALLGLGYTSQWQGLAHDHLLLWNGTQADAQHQAVAWVRAHVPPTAHILTDDYLYTDLHDGVDGTPVFPRADWYQKVARDPAIRDAIYHNNWRNFDYVLTTSQLTLDARIQHLDLVAQTLAHAVTVAHFDTGGWPVNVMEVMKPNAPVLGAVPYQQAKRQFLFVGAVNTPTERSILMLTNPGVLPASVVITFYLQNGTANIQQVLVDASSRLQVRVSDYIRAVGSLGVRVQSSKAIGASLLVSRSSRSAQVIDRGVSTHWTINSSALPWALLSGNNAGTSSDAASAAADYDGVGSSYSAQALAAAGIRPGEQIVYDGAAFGWPDVLPGTQDNMAAQGQTIVLPTPAPGAALAFLGSATHGPSSGTATITYADGTRQRARLGFSDWTLNGGRAGQPIYGNRAVVTLPYRNHVSGNREGVRTYLFEAEIPLVAGKAVVSVTLPSSVDQGALHVFAVALRS